MIEKAKQY